MFTETAQTLGDRPGQLSSVIGSEASIVGDVRVTGSLRVDGEIEGDVMATKRVQVGEDGRVNGDLRAEHLLVAGRVHGRIRGELIHLKATAIVTGNVEAARLVMEEGASLDGSCAMGGPDVPRHLEVVERGRA